MSGRRPVPSGIPRPEVRRPVRPDAVRRTGGDGCQKAYAKRFGYGVARNLGTHRGMWDDDWTVVTGGRRASAEFDHGLLVTDAGAEILTLP